MKPNHKTLTITTKVTFFGTDDAFRDYLKDYLEFLSKNSNTKGSLSDFISGKEIFDCEINPQYCIKRFYKIELPEEDRGFVKNPLHNQYRHGFKKF